METVAGYAAPLSAGEIETRKACERIIEHGLRTFYEVGTALLQIRDQKLYRVSHRSFEEYCRQRWGLQERRVYQLMDAAAIVEDLKSCTVVQLPQNERQARALAQVEPELRPGVLEAAVATAPNGRLTTAHIIETAGIVSVAPPASPVEAVTVDVTPDAPYIHFSSDSDEWYTPQKIIDPVLALFDTIDLDPCSNSKTSPNIPASEFYTKADDGLSLPWYGRMFVNPPYSDVLHWVEKACASYRPGARWRSDPLDEASRAEAIILLVAARTETIWFGHLWQYPLCFVRGRLQFRSPADKVNSAPIGSVVAYLGPDPDGFVRVFGELGHIVMGGGTT